MMKFKRNDKNQFYSQRTVWTFVVKSECGNSKCEILEEGWQNFYLEDG